VVREGRGNTLMTMPKASLVRAIVMNHWIHHRGQLSVYLRLLDVPVPSIYGPSADENPSPRAPERRAAARVEPAPPSWPAPFTSAPASAAACAVTPFGGRIMRVSAPGACSYFADTLLVVVVSLVAACSRVEAETHRFIPNTFYNTYSFAHPPALRIKPGDRVVTKTIDAAGTDRPTKTMSVAFVGRSAYPRFLTASAMLEPAPAIRRMSPR